jgi:PAS domain S-box-containing protein
LSLILLATTTAGFFMLRRFEVVLHESIISKNQLLALTIANSIKTHIDSHVLSLGLLHNHSFRNQEGVDGLERQYPSFSSVFTVNADGVVEFASSRSRERSHDVSRRDFFINANEKKTLFLSSSFIAEGDYTPTAVLALPYQDGLAVGYLRLTSLSGYLMSLPVVETETIAVVDGRGYFVAHSDLQKVTGRVSVALEPWFQKKILVASDSMIIEKPDGSTHLVCWAPLDNDSGWVAMISLSTQRAFSYARAIGTAMALAMVIVGSLAIALVVLVLFKFDRDIRYLRVHTRAIADGLYDTELAYDGFKDLQPLVQDFRRAVEAVKDRESRIQESQRRLERLVNSIPVPMMVLDDSGRITLMNKAMTGLVGWSPQEIRTLDEWWPIIYPDEEYRNAVKEKWGADLSAIRRGSMPEQPFDGRIQCKDGSLKTVMASPAIVGDTIVSTFVDISAAKKYEEAMAANLAEKEILLKEIHHRVKNNLQLIVSLLTLKAAGTAEGEEVFADSIDRIRVMATIHELLYESKNFARIELGEYITTIVEWILSSYAYKDPSPRLKLDLEEIHLDIDSAIPCGLIINELFTNAIKYAFSPGQPDPEVCVKTAIGLDGIITLGITDNGIGMPAGIEPGSAETLGLQLIVSLTEQLHGVWELSRQGGTVWTIRFPRQAMLPAHRGPA